MSAVEISEVVKFLQQTPPFQLLDESGIRSMAGLMNIRYLKGGERYQPDPQGGPALNLIRRGACEIQSAEGKLVDRIADGECFGVASLLEQNPERASVMALEDSLVYQLDKADFDQIGKQYPSFLEYFWQTRSNRLRKLSASSQGSTFNVGVHYNSPVTNLMSRRLVSTFTTTSIVDAAKLMTRERVSALLVLERKELKGILTDRDLRSRVIAKGISTDRPLSEVMSSELITLSDDALLLHAQLLMSEHNVHHLPIVDRFGNAVGIVTVTDLLRNQQLSPLLLVSEINRQRSTEALAVIAERIPELISNLVMTEMNPADVGEVLATVTDTITRKLIDLAIEDLGDAPMDFAWLVFGSQARKDQSLGSDQDNALMLSREPNTEETEYFKALAKFVSDGLNLCGIVYCPGNIMATNPEWVKTEEQWLVKFQNWVESPSPTALLNAVIFFDIRRVYGYDTGVRKLVSKLAELCRKNEIFLATMMRNAAQSKTPLGFFRDFVVDRSGAQKDKLDLKHHGLALINDLARIYGLASHSAEAATLKRLECAKNAGILTRDDMLSLEDAWEFLSELRLQVQQASWQKNGKASAYLNPKTLSPLERQHLKSTFQTIHDAQEGAMRRFTRGLG